MKFSIFILSFFTALSAHALNVQCLPVGEDSNLLESMTLTVRLPLRLKQANEGYFKIVAPAVYYNVTEKLVPDNGKGLFVSKEKGADRIILSGSDQNESWEVLVSRVDLESYSEGRELKINVRHSPRFLSNYYTREMVCR